MALVLVSIISVILVFGFLSFYNFVTVIWAIRADNSSSAPQMRHKRVNQKTK